MKRENKIIATFPLIIFLALILITRDQSSYQKTLKIDHKILSIIKNDLQKGQSVEQIRDYLEQNKAALHISKVSPITKTKDFKTLEELKSFIIYSKIFSFYGLAKGRYIDMRITIDGHDKNITRAGYMDGNWYIFQE